MNEREWGVSQRNCNHSAFNGYRQTYSDYSTVHCLACGTVGRTKASYVPQLLDVSLVHGTWQFKHRCAACGKPYHSTIRSPDNPDKLKCAACTEAETSDLSPFSVERPPS